MKGMNKLGTLKSNGTNKTYPYNADGTTAYAARRSPIMCSNSRRQ